jgi:uncharacterized DUF497 family protein
MKNFDWDENKRESNLQKHGIDFVDAVEVFHDVDRVELESIRNSEKRYQVIGMVNEVVILVVYTIRNEKIRIISSRIASRKEREAYYNLR